MLGIGTLAKKVFGTPNDRKVKSVRPLVAKINALEPEFKALTDDEIKAKTEALSVRAQGGESLDDLLPEAFAFEALLADDAVVLASHQHPLAGQAQIPLTALQSARWVLPTANIAVRDIFEREVLPLLPQAQWFPVSTVSLPVLRALLSQPLAVVLLPRSIVPGINTAADLCVLDVQLGGAHSALAPLGVAYRKEGAPQLLREMLKLWRASRPESA